MMLAIGDFHRLLAVALLCCGGSQPVLYASADSSAQWHIVTGDDQAIVCDRSVDSPWPFKTWADPASPWTLDDLPAGMIRCTLPGEEHTPTHPDILNMALLLDADSQWKRIGVPCFGSASTHQVFCCLHRAQVFGLHNHHWHNCTETESATQ